MADLSRFKQPIIFEDVAIGQSFSEGLSSSNAIYKRVEQFQQESRHGTKTFNGRRVTPGQPRYKWFVNWEPVFVEVV